MKRVESFFLLVIVPLLPSTALLAADEDADRVRQLVVRLGHERFAERENATEELIEIGLPALDALQAAQKNADREIRYRAVRIMAIIRDLDFQRRLAAFARNQDEQEYDLPAWNRFQERLGDGATARALFVAMQKEESAAMKALEEGPKAAANFVNFRSQQLLLRSRQVPREIELGSIAAMLFISGDDEVPLTAQVSRNLYSLCYQSSFKEAISGGPHKKLVRELVGGWIRRGTDSNGYQGLILAMRHDLKEGLGLANKFLKEGGNQTHVRQYAILTIAKLGGEEQIPLLEKLLDDKTRTTSRRVKKDGKTLTYETQIRDVALATLLKLTKQDLGEYGFDNLQMHPQYVFNTSTLGFADPKKREAGLKKWKELRGMK